MQQTPTWRAYIALIRLDKPIGIWLLFYPAAWAVAIASPGAPDPYLLLLLLIGAVLMRSAGCIMNDLADRKLDDKVARTKTRPLANGDLSVRQAFGLLTILLSGAFGLLFLLPHNPLILALLVLPAVAIYPLMKRITFWPQAFLGLTFNTSVLFGWFEASGGALSLEAFILYAACCFWTLGYDTIYALQDVADDIKIGVKSTARWAGERAHLLVGFSYFCMVVGFGFIAYRLTVGDMYLLALFMLAAHLYYQFWMVKLHHDTHAQKLFLSNATIGLWVFCLLMLDRYDVASLWR